MLKEKNYFDVVFAIFMTRRVYPVIGILHSGDLEEVSLGGISEYVRQFIKYTNEELILYGLVPNCNFQGRGRISTKFILNKRTTFISVCSDKKRPLTLAYIFNLFILLVLQPKKFADVNVFYAQRMEFVLPFVLAKRKKKVVFAVHGSSAYSARYWGWFKSKIYLFLEWIAVRRASSVFILNDNPDYGMHYYKDRYPMYRHKFQYMRVPVDTAIFKSSAKTNKKKRPLVLYSGRLEHNPKRVLCLPRILYEVRRKIDVTMNIVGEGTDKQGILRIARELGIENYIEFTPYVKVREELSNVISAADVSLVISVFEGICMSALESLSCGVPVVATRVGDLSSYIIDEVNGILVENTSDDTTLIKNVSNAIINVLSNPLIKGQPVLRFEARTVIAETTQKLMNISEDV